MSVRNHARQIGRKLGVAVKWLLSHERTMIWLQRIGIPLTVSMIAAWPIASFSEMSYFGTILRLMIATVVIIGAILAFRRSRRAKASRVRPPVPVVESSASDSEEDGDESGEDHNVTDITKLLPVHEVDIPARTLEVLKRMDERQARMEERQIAAGKPLPPDTKVYWDQNPHVKHFLKRLWRIVVAWTVVLMVAALAIAAVQLAQVALDWLMAIPAAGAIATWYTARRYYKWRHLRLMIIGYDLWVKEPRNWFYMLYGQEQALELIECNKIATGQTVLEGFLSLKCGRVSIMQVKDNREGSGAGQSVVMNDMFGVLEDVRDYNEFAAEVKKQRQRIMAMMSGGGQIIRHG